MVRRNRTRCLGDVAPGRLETLLVAVARPAEQRPHVFLEHGERCVRQPGFEARGLDDEDRRSSRRFEFGDVRDSHDRALVDQSREAGGMDASGACRVDPKPSRIFEAIQQCDDVRGRGRLRVVPQPGEARPAQVRIDRQQSRQRVPLGVGHPGRECLEGFLSCPGPGGQPDPLQHRRQEAQGCCSRGDGRASPGRWARRDPWPRRHPCRPEGTPPFVQSEASAGPGIFAVRATCSRRV